jgi:hypothetical protein
VTGYEATSGRVIRRGVAIDRHVSLKAATGADDLPPIGATSDLERAHVGSNH